VRRPHAERPADRAADDRDAAPAGPDEQPPAAGAAAAASGLAMQREPVWGGIREPVRADSGTRAAGASRPGKAPRAAVAPVAARTAAGARRAGPDAAARGGIGDRGRRPGPRPGRRGPAWPARPAGAGG